MTLRTVFAWIFLCLGIFGLGTGTASAASLDPFTVTQAIDSTDSSPPTIPANLTSTPITTSQIDLDWDASSDNIGVAGYQVFRDATQIATTTLTSYSDVGLTASTTYAYYVSAFDAALNISTSSATNSTTTLSVTIPPATTSTSTGGSTRSRLQYITFESVDFEVTTDSIELWFETNIYTQASIKWGRTFGFEGGYTTSDIFRRKHQTRIDGLEPGTVYEIELSATDRRFSLEESTTLTITTESGPDTISPTNVSNFVAQVIDASEVELQWKLPDDTDFSHVRVLSSDQFFPTHVADGWLVYEGTDTMASDTRLLPPNQRRYYTIFVYDTAGNTSSGVVTFAEWIRPTAPPATGAPGVAPPIPGPGSTSEPVTEPPSLFSFDDLIIEQNGEVRPTLGGEVYLDGGEEILISLPYELVPERLKTIVVTMEHPNDSDRVFSFLLRINHYKTAYEAKLSPLREGGTYQTAIEVFDFSTRELSTTFGKMIVEESLYDLGSDTEYLTVGKLAKNYLRLISLALLSTFIILSLILLAAKRRRSEDSDLQK